MKILLTMVLAMGLCVSSLEAQQDLLVATEESLAEQSQQDATKHRRQQLIPLPQGMVDVFVGTKTAIDAQTDSLPFLFRVE